MACRYCRAGRLVAGVGIAFSQLEMLPQQWEADCRSCCVRQNFRPCWKSLAQSTGNTQGRNGSLLYSSLGTSTELYEGTWKLCVGWPAVISKHLSVWLEKTHPLCFSRGYLPVARSCKAGTWHMRAGCKRKKSHRYYSHSTKTYLQSRVLAVQLSKQCKIRSVTTLFIHESSPITNNAY